MSAPSVSCDERTRRAAVRSCSSFRLRSVPRSSPSRVSDAVSTHWDVDFITASSFAHTRKIIVVAMHTSLSHSNQKRSDDPFIHPSATDATQVRAWCRALGWVGGRILDWVAAARNQLVRLPVFNCSATCHPLAGCG